MLRRMALATMLVIAPTAASAAVRTFTDHQGHQLAADFTGVKDGMVVLKERGTRKLYPLAAFSLDDREFVIDSLRSRKQIREIRDLMAYAVRNTIASPRDSEQESLLAPGEVRVRPLKPGALTSEQAIVDRDLTLMYGILLPTEGLLSAPEARPWTDLAGETVEATFEEVLPPGLVVLKLSTGARQQVPLVNLVREDVDQIRALLAADLERPVFPEVDVVPPAPEELREGLRLFHDRRSMPLVGKYKRRVRDVVTLEVAGIDQEYPFRGLSEDDRRWIGQEDRRRRTQSAVRPQGFEPGDGRAAPPALPQPRNAPQQNHPRPPQAAPQAAPPQDGNIPGAAIHERCPKCGLEWVRNDARMAEACPRCANQESGTPWYETTLGRCVLGALAIAGIVMRMYRWKRFFAKSC